MRTIFFITLLVSFFSHSQVYTFPELEKSKLFNVNVNVNVKVKVEYIIRESEVKKIIINDQQFEIKISEKVDMDRVPFTEVIFPKNEGIKIYSFEASNGTSGRQMYYFFKTISGRFVMSKLLPEIFFEQDFNRFVSYEKDGSRVYETLWEMTASGFVKL